MWTVENRARYDRSGRRHPSDLTEEEWASAAQHNVLRQTLRLYRRIERYVCGDEVVVTVKEHKQPMGKSAAAW